jgi:DHA2 family multidrug resistance protein
MTETVTAPATPARAGLTVWAGFTAMTVGMFLAILDIQIVASSLIDIQSALGIPADRLSYLQTAYLIAEIIAIALTGWLTRVMSTRWLFVVAMLGFVGASLGCAASTTYPSLYAWRVVQGLFGGALIPLVFTAVFIVFPVRQQGVATAIGGGLAMLAPTVGPFIGGWITETLSWHWLFLINFVPGVVAAAVVARTIRVDRPDWAAVRQLDVAALALIAVCLGTLELTLKEAPGWGWGDPLSLALASVCVATGVLSVVKSVRSADPLIEMSAFRNRTFAVGAWFSFVLGFALFGSVYLLPLYLGIVRGHGPLEIGTIMIVMGATQLVIAPLATVMEQRMDARAMTALGYALFGAGLIWNGFATQAWDFAELFGPQVLRGAAVMICLLPVTRLALGQLPSDKVANASALFNLMRNVGGAVGLALIDTVIHNRPAHHVERIVAALQAGDRDMAVFVGLPPDSLTPAMLATVDEAAIAFVRPLVERAATVASFNEAWLMIGGLAILSLAMLPLMKAPRANGS